ncbi:hypothetical protein DFH07DRAFT_767382 [Mycena maculata]|uniref:Uncharacterized protein n=1 Tax=Mycena maculata TaxID=230809 RepID=A0AAD7K085_9AGAR|nr:hypothetical protein DFH07DRAFT_767382 [Mycena maculata]
MAKMDLSKYAEKWFEGQPWTRGQNRQDPTKWPFPSCADFDVSVFKTIVEAGGDHLDLVEEGEDMDDGVASADEDADDAEADNIDTTDVDMPDVDACICPKFRFSLKVVMMSVSGRPTTARRRPVRLGAAGRDARRGSERIHLATRAKLDVQCMYISKIPILTQSSHDVGVGTDGDGETSGQRASGGQGGMLGDEMSVDTWISAENWTYSACSHGVGVETADDGKTNGQRASEGLGGMLELDAPRMYMPKIPIFIQSGHGVGVGTAGGARQRASGPRRGWGGC